jgi:hypothetical protein
MSAQVALMRRDFPEFAPRWRGGKVTWRGTLSPTPLSPSYPVRVEYEYGLSPRVFPVSKFPGRQNERPPHIYPQGHLCLHKPQYRDWSPVLPVSQTVMPWTALWFFFYEAWMVTGEWAAKGEHPSLDRRTTGVEPVATVAAVGGTP